MKANVGSTDKTIRIILGVVLLIVGFSVQMSAGLKTVVFVISGIALVTAFINFCPLWAALGINTKKEK